MTSSAPTRPRVLVTRAAQQGSDLAGCLRVLGAEPVLIPAIETVEPTSFAALDKALGELEDFHWILFTSANAVEAFANRLAVGRRALDSVQAHPDQTNHTKIAAIGPATARALKKIGLNADVVPLQAIAESLTEALLPHTRQPNGTPTRFLLIRAEEAREHLPETVRAAGAEVTIAPAYRTAIPAGSVDLVRRLFTPQAPIDGITFTSSSTARNLVGLCEAAQVTLPEAALRISIGPITSQTLRDFGIPPHAEAPEATVPSLAETVMTALKRHRP